MVASRACPEAIVSIDILVHEWQQQPWQQKLAVLQALAQGETRDQCIDHAPYNSITMMLIATCCEYQGQNIYYNVKFMHVHLSSAHVYSLLSQAWQNWGW